MHIMIEYSLKSLKRNPFRSFQNVFGILMAMAIISAVIFYNDLAREQFITTTLNDIEVDMIIQPVSGISSFFGRELEADVQFNPIEGQKYLLNQSLVKNAEFYFESTSSVIASNLNHSNKEMKLRIVGIQPSYLTAFPGVFRLIDGQFPTKINKTEPLPVLLPLKNQIALGIRMGELLNVSHEGFALQGFNIITKNYSIVVKVVGTIEIQPSSMFFGLNLISDRNLMILPLWNVTEWEGFLFSSLGMLPPTINERIHVKLDHEKLPKDPNKAATMTHQFSNKIQGEIPGRVIVIDNIGLSVFFINIASFFVQFILLFLSLPAIILALYMQKFAIESSLENRMNEITMLKTRGGETKEIAIMLAMEVGSLALLSMLAGIIVGDLLSQIIFQTKSFLTLNIADLQLKFSLERLNSQNVLVLGSISIFFVFISAYLPIKSMLSEQDITTGLAEFQLPKPPLWKRIYLDFIFIAIGIIMISLQVILGFGLREGGFLFVIFAAVAPALFWLGCILSLARLGSQIVQKTEKIIIAIFNTISSLGEIIAKSSARRPENLSKVIILLTLVFSFGVLISTTAETTHRTIIYRSYALVGADVRINLATPDNTTLVAAISQLITTTDSNARILPVTVAEVVHGGSKIRIIPTSEEFIDISMINQHYLRTGTRMENVRSIFNSEEGGAIINRELSVDFNITKNKPLFDWNVTVKGIAKQLPNLKTIDFSRLSFAFSGIPTDVEYQVLMNEKNWNQVKTSLAKDITEDLVILVKTSRPMEIKTRISAEFKGNVEVFTQPEMVKAIEEESAANFNGVFTIEFYISILVASIGLIVFLFHEINQRKREMGTIIALGATRKQLTLFLLGDSVIAAFFSVIFGGLIGLITAYLLDIFNSETSTRIIQASLTISISGILQLIIFLLLGITMATLLAAWRIQRIAPAQVLRIE